MVVLDFCYCSVTKARKIYTACQIYPYCISPPAGMGACCSCSISQQSPTLCNPMYYIAHPTPLSMGFPRQEYWSRLTFASPGDPPYLGIEPVSLALAGGFFTTEPPGKPCVYMYMYVYMYMCITINVYWLGRKETKLFAFVCMCSETGNELILDVFIAVAIY